MRTQTDNDPKEAGEDNVGLTMFGATTCEDTALVRSRLQFAGVPFEELDVDVDESAAADLARLTGGRPTPTLVFPPVSAGGAETIVSEPGLDRLDALLNEAGFRPRSPAVIRFHGDLTDLPIPSRTLVTSREARFSIEDVRSRWQLALFLGHDSSCLACMGFAKQLARQADRLTESDAIAVAAMGDGRGLQPLAVWHREVGPELTILVDRGTEWKRATLQAVGHPEAEVALLMLDRFGAPVAGSFGEEAGALANPSEAADWLGFSALACPECSIELPWPEPAETARVVADEVGKRVAAEAVR